MCLRLPLLVLASADAQIQMSGNHHALESNMTEAAAEVGASQRDINMQGTFRERVDLGTMLAAYIPSENHAAMPDQDFMRGKLLPLVSGSLRFTAGVSRRREPIERAIVATADADVATHRLAGQSCCP